MLVNGKCKWAHTGAVMACFVALSTVIRFVFEGLEEQSDLFSSENTVCLQSFSNSF